MTPRRTQVFKDSYAHGTGGYSTFGRPRRGEWGDKMYALQCQVTEETVGKAHAEFWQFVATEIKDNWIIGAAIH